MKRTFIEIGHYYLTDLFNSDKINNKIDIPYVILLPLLEQYKRTRIILNVFIDDIHSTHLTTTLNIIQDKFDAAGTIIKYVKNTIPDNYVVTVRYESDYLDTYMQYNFIPAFLLQDFSLYDFKQRGTITQTGVSKNGKEYGLFHVTEQGLIPTCLLLSLSLAYVRLLNNDHTIVIIDKKYEHVEKKVKELLPFLYIGRNTMEWIVNEQQN